MVRLFAQLCEDPSCGTRSSFGYEGDRKVKRCAEHKLNGMIDLVNKMCKHPKCNRHASFGYEADKQLVRCKEDSEENMVLLTSRKCAHPTCNSNAAYGEPGTNVSTFFSTRETLLLYDIRLHEVLTLFTHPQSCFGVLLALARQYDRSKGSVLSTNWRVWYANMSSHVDILSVIQSQYLVVKLTW
jgi:EsV-1-7 cysteine-rich motif